MSQDALIVGINTYKYQHLKSLKTPSENAEAIAQRLTEYGSFRVKRIPESVQPDKSLRVGCQTEVSSKQLRKAIAQLFKPEGNQLPETALLYFSGHGLRNDEGIEEGFLATSDVNPDLDNWGLSLQWLRRLLEASPIKQQIVWLDCCYSGELFNFDENLKEADPGNKDGVDRCLITASREFEVAYEEISGIHGVLTGALLKGLDPQERPDGWVTTHTLADFINKELKTETQHPLCHNSGSPIILTTCKPKSVNSLDEGICPYKGLEYFKQKDARFFWGRTALTDELIEQVRTENFIAVLGESGSGKSSVLRAGLLHQLSLGVKLTGSDRWQIYQPFTPGEHPLQNLEAVIDRPANELNQLVTEAETSRVVLVVDQFEECFTLCQDSRERKQFFDCLLSAVEREDNKLCLVLGMRADFLGKCAEYAGLANKIDNHLLVKPMTLKELEEAIIKPAEQVGLQVEPQLVTRMIEDVADSPGSLPLLQYTLMELWKVRREPLMNWLTLFSYDQLGGDKGGIKGILEKRANEVYESLNEEEKPVAQRIFLELTQLGEVADTRMRVRKEDLINSQHSEDLLDGVISKLAKERLIITSKPVLSATPDQSKTQDSQLTQTDELIPHKRKCNAVIDITHEALIRYWEKLRKWVEDYRVPLEIERRIEAYAREWAEQGRPESLLLREGRLAEAENYKNNYLKLGFLDGVAQEFIEESIELRERLRQEEEERRQQEQKQVISLLIQVCENHLFSNRQLEALIAAVQAGKKLKNANLKSDTVLPPTVSLALQEAVYGVKERNRLIGHTDYINVVSFSPDGQIIASGSNNAIKLWSREGKLLNTLPKDASASSISFSPDSKTIVSGNYGGTIQIWSREGHLIREFPKEPTKRINSISLSPDGQMIASGGYDQTIKLWSLDGHLLHTLTGHHANVRSVTFSRDGQLIASISEDETIKLWSREGQLLHTFCQDQDKYKDTRDDVGSVSFSPDGQVIASGGYDGTVKLWSREGELLQTLKGHIGFVTNVSFSPDGRVIASSSFDGTVKLWSREGELLQTLKGHESLVSSVSFSPDGKTLASSSWDLTIKLWKVEGQPLQTLAGHNSAVSSVSFSPDGKMIASGSYDETITLWSREGELLQTLPGHSSTVYSVSFSPDGQIASGSEDATIKLWSREGQLLKNLTQVRSAVYSVSFSPDGKTLASTSQNGIVKLWGLNSQEFTDKNLTGHGTLVYSVSFSPDGNLLASGDLVGTIKLWSRNGQQLKTLTGHSNSVNSVSFSPDGKTLASASRDNTVILWNLDLDDLLVKGCDWLHDYLKNESANLSEGDRDICDGINSVAG